MGRSQRFVSVTTTYDPVRAEVIRDLLDQEGIPATIAGAHHNSLLGAAGAMIEIRVQVPERQVERAAEIIGALDDEDQVLVDDSAEAAALRHVDHVDPMDARGPRSEVGEGPYRRAPRRRELERPRLKRIASFLALAVTFGTGHIYARETASGVVLLVAELFVLFAGASHPPVMWALPMLMLVDLVGSLRAVDRANAGAPYGVGVQLSRSVPLAVGALALCAWAVPPLVEVLRPVEAPASEDERVTETSEGERVTEIDPADVFEWVPERSSGSPEPFGLTHEP